MQRDTQEPDDSRFLEGLLALADGGEPGWAESDLALIWQHQLAAPLAFDLGELSPNAGVVAIALCAPVSVKSLADLIKHPSPPLELLQMLKDFARSKRTEAHSAYPNAIAVALYYTSIGLALVRLDCRLTRMHDLTLRGGMEWLTQQVWLDQATRDLAIAAGDCITHPNPI